MDQFYVIVDNGLPVGTDTIVDFEVGTEFIGITGVSGVDGFEDLDLIQQGNNTLINSSDTSLFKLNGIQANTLGRSNFIFA